MVHSMTGFGRKESTLFSKKIAVEIKVLNSKNIDVSLKLPFEYRSLEQPIRTLISTQLVRGKVEFAVYLEKSPPSEFTSEINEEKTRQYMSQLQRLVPTLKESDSLQMAMNMPHVLKEKEGELPPQEINSLLELTKEALEEVVAFRKNEGNALAKDLQKHILQMNTLLADVEKKDPERKIKIKERLQGELDTLTQKVDETRLEQELLYYIEKYDISEEKTRLKAHLEYFQSVLDADAPHGKKLGFIAQEILREVNTIGSKAHHFEIQKSVVLMKETLEKIREQVLNVL